MLLIFSRMFLLLYKCSGYFLKDKAKEIRNKSLEFNLDFAHVQQLDFGQITQPTMRKQILTELGGNDNKWL